MNPWFYAHWLRKTDSNTLKITHLCDLGEADQIISDEIKSENL